MSTTIPEITSAFSDLQFLDLIKTTQVCTLKANLQTVFNALNIYESLIYSDTVDGEIQNYTTANNNAVKKGDYVLKQKNNVALLIKGPSTTTYIPKMTDALLQWTSALGATPGTFDITGANNANGLVAARVDSPFSGLMGSTFPRIPIVSFYNASNEPVNLSTLPYTIGGSTGAYTLRWDTVPGYISYAVVR